MLYTDVNLKTLPGFLIEMLREILRREGEWSDDENDHKTKWGIRQITADQWGYTGDLRDLSKDDAGRIWTCHAWYEPKYDLIYRVSPLICETVIDTSGPAGQSVSTLHLQRALNSLNDPVDDITRHYRYGDDLTEDGHIGMETASRLAAYLDHRGVEGETIMVIYLNSMQAYHYYLVTNANTGKRDFMYGWLRGRVAPDLRHAIEREV